MKDLLFDGEASTGQKADRVGQCRVGSGRPCNPTDERWNLLDINNWQNTPAKQPVPRTESEYFGLDPFQRRALARRFQAHIRPRTPQADIAGLAGCNCNGAGLGFLPGTPLPEPDPIGWDYNFDWGWLNNLFDWGAGYDYGIDPVGGGGGGGGILLGPDDCGRPVTHPSYGCPCGSMWSGDYMIGCINPCPEGSQIEWTTIRHGNWDDPNATIEYREECKPTATQAGNTVCPQGTVKNGVYCVDPGSGSTRTPVPRPGSNAGGGSGGSGSPSPRVSPSRNPLPAGSNNAAAALAQAQALCARVGKTYDQQARRCVGGPVVQQNAFGVLQNQVGGVPVWGWALAVGAVILISRR